MSTTFNPTEQYTLQDDKVLLRPLQAADAEFLIPFAINEPDTWFYSLKSAAGEEGMRQYIIVFDIQTQQYAGCTRFYDIQPAYQSLQLGYTWYGSAFRGTGLNKHCKFLLLQFAFETLGMQRVEFRADARNNRSIAAMKSIGCTPEGILRNHLPLAEGGRRDSIILSILKHEWLGGAKQRLADRL